MPKIQWDHLPKEKWAHLRARAKEREISIDDLVAVANWKAQDPDVPDGEWYRDFGTFKLCGKGRVSEHISSAKPNGPRQKRLTSDTMLKLARPRPGGVTKLASRCPLAP